jgi:hypothetical protein
MVPLDGEKLIMEGGWIEVVVVVVVEVDVELVVVVVVLGPEFVALPHWDIPKTSAA